MYKCIIVEDELHVAHQLEKLLRDGHAEVNICGIADSVNSGFELIQLYKPNLLFLDIRLGAESGFDLLKMVENIDFEFIVVTAYDRFAIEAIRWSVADYLLKPVLPLELHEALQKAYRKLAFESESLQGRMKNTLDNWFARMASDHVQIALPMANEMLMVKASEIVRLAADGSYTWFYFSGGNSLLITKGLYYFEKKLIQLGFIRCHPTHLVNRRYIKRLVQADGLFELVLDYDIRISVSRKYHKSVKEMLRAG